MVKFAVINLEEALYIRRVSENSRILFLGVFDISKLEIYKANSIEITITSIDSIKEINISNLMVQIEIDSGMNRYGVLPCELDEVLKVIKSKELVLTGVYSHNATNNHKYIKSQLNVLKQAQIAGVETHFSSSSLMNHDFYNIRRIGLFIYEDSLTVYGKITKINYCKKNTYIGYDYKYKFKKDCYVGVIDIGYADGLERDANGFMVVIDNKKFPLVGNSCMNCSFVLLDGANYLNKNVYFISDNNKVDNYVKYFNKIAHDVYLRFLK